MGQPLCPTCGHPCRPDVVLYGEQVPDRHKHRIYKFLKTATQVVVVGTSMQFPYLEDFLVKARKRGLKITHINVDPEYDMDQTVCMEAAAGLRQVFKSFFLQQ
jgi:NAD-dependent SIR2 family protein deacetylase